MSLLVIIHGENQVKSHLYLSALLTKLAPQNKHQLSVEVVTDSEFKNALYSMDFFGNAPTVILNITNMGRMNVDSFINVAKNIPDQTNLIIFSEKELSNANAFIKNAAALKAKIVKNEVLDKPSVFKYLDAVFSPNKAATYKSLRDLIVGDEDIFYIFSMLSGNIRNLALAKFDAPSISSVNPYVASKAKQNSQNLSTDEVKNLYLYTYQTDLDMKSGRIDPEVGLVMLTEKIQSTCQHDKKIH